jgi:AsmA-like protein
MTWVAASSDQRELGAGWFREPPPSSKTLLAVPPVVRCITIAFVKTETGLLMKIKKKLIKIGIIILGSILLLIIAGAIIFHLYGGKLMKMGIEKGGEYALKVPVTVDDVSLSILGGNAGLSNLAISNPPKKYEHEHMLTLGNGQVHLKVKSVFSDTIEIESILLEDIEIVMEKEKLGFGNNIQDILNNLPSGDEEPKEDPEEPGKNLHIRKLEIRNAKVNLKLLHISGKFGTAPIPLDTIILTDLGSDKELKVAELTGIILKALVNGIMKSGKGIIPDEILGPMGDTLKKLGDVTGQILQEGGKILEEGGKATEKLLDEGGKGLEGIGKGIGDLLKPKEKEKAKEEEKK